MAVAGPLGALGKLGTGPKHNKRSTGETTETEAPLAAPLDYFCCLDRRPGRINKLMDEQTSGIKQEKQAK